MKRLTYLVAVLLLASFNLQAQWGPILSASRSSAAAWTYYSAVFDGSTTYVAKTSNLTGISDGKIGLISFWVKPGTNFDIEYLLREDSGYFEVIRTGANLVQVNGYNAAASKILDLTSTTQIDAGTWYWVCVSFDLGTAGRSYIYINGVDRTTRNTHTNDSINFTSGGWGTAAKSDGSGLIALKLCEYYFTTPAAWFDITNSTNRDKFYNSGTSKPVDLGANGSTPTGTQPLVYFHNQPAPWGTNLGSGGTFTTTGTITDGGSDKP